MLGWGTDFTGLCRAFISSLPGVFNQGVTRSAFSFQMITEVCREEQTVEAGRYI